MKYTSSNRGKFEHLEYEHCVIIIPRVLFQLSKYSTPPQDPLSILKYSQLMSWIYLRIDKGSFGI